MLVDGDIHALPAGAGHAHPAIAVNAMADAPDLPQILDVQVHQLRGPGAFIPHHGQRRLEGGQLIEPESPQFGRDRQEGDVVVLRVNANNNCTLSQGRIVYCGWGMSRELVRPPGDGWGGRASGCERAPAYAQCGGNGALGFARVDARHDELSRPRGQSCILVGVQRGSGVVSGRLDNLSLLLSSLVNNLLRIYT